MGSKKSRKKEKQIISEIEAQSKKTSAVVHPTGFRINIKMILALSAILLITIVVYSNSLSNGFVNWDDNINVYDNIYIRQISLDSLKVFFTEPLLAMYTPLVYISYAIDYKIGGLNPSVYHATNLLLHLLNIAILFFSTRLLTQRTEIATIVAFLFAVHPMNTGTVAPISTRSGLLYSFFFLAAFLSYLNYLKNDLRTKYLVLTFILFLFALLSKSAAVVLPLLLLLTDYYFSRKFDTRTITEKIPFFALALIFGILTFIFREDASSIGNRYVFSVFDRIFLAGYSLLFYLFKMFAPIKLSAYYQYPAKIDGHLPVWFYIAPLVVAMLVYLLYRLKDYGKELVFGSLFFLINIVLVLKIIPMGGELVCDRYVYLPYIGLFMIIGWAYCRLADKYLKSSNVIKYLLIIIPLAYGIVISAAAHERIKVWKDSITLFNDILAKDPLVDVAYNNRGMSKMELKDYAGAMDDLNKAIELNPSYALAYANRGMVKAEFKDYAGALQDYNRAIEISPQNSIAYNNRGNAKFEIRDYPGAIDDFNRAIQIDPQNAAAYANRGKVKSLGLKDYAGAMQDFGKAIELNPFYINSYFNRALARMEQKDYEGALADYNRVIEIDPRVSRAYYGRGNIRVFQNDHQGAVDEYSRAIASNPNYAEAYRNRGNMRMMQEKYNDAVADYNEALRVNPKDGGLYFRRGWGRWFTKDKGGACADWGKANELGFGEAAAIMQRNCR